MAGLSPEAAPPPRAPSLKRLGTRVHRDLGTPRIVGGLVTVSGFNIVDYDYDQLTRCGALAPFLLCNRKGGFPAARRLKRWWRRVRGRAGAAAARLLQRGSFRNGDELEEEELLRKEAKRDEAERIALETFDVRGIMGGRFMAGQMLALSFLAFLVAWFTCGVLDRKGSTAAADMESLSGVVAGLTSIIAFYVTALLKENTNRWHKIREDYVESLWASVNELSVRAALYFPLDTKAHKEVKGKLLRWGLLSVQLLFFEAGVNLDSVKGDESFEDAFQVDYDDLGADTESLITEHERELLKTITHSRSQAIWVWVASYLTKLALDGMLPNPAGDRETFLKLCLGARTAIRKIISSMETQNPFSMMYQLTFMVKIYIIMTALVQGIMLGVAFRSKAWIHLFFFTISFLVTVFFFQTIMETFSKMRNPFGKDAIDFPLEVYKAKIKQEGLDFRLAGEVPPSNICMGPKQLPPFWPPQRMDSQVSKGGNTPVQWASHWTARKDSSS